jgi:WD40 repeat protein
MKSRSEGMGDIDDEEEEESKSEGTLLREYENALKVEDEEGFEGEIRLMASLFESDKKRYQKLLAVRDNHTSPVNCVRWNPLGTLFISCSDDGSIILWEYVGEMNMQASGFQKSMYNVAPSQDSGRMGLGGAGNAAVEENKAG